MTANLKRLLRPYVLIGRRIRRERLTVNKAAWAQPLSFSQFGEDRFLARFFQNQSNGFYVDVGAYHPFNASNTFLLYDRGWSGINLEPAPDGLAELRRHRPRDINLPIAVAPEAGRVTYSMSGAFAGIVDEQRLWTDASGRTTVDAMPLSEILDKHLPSGQAIDLLDVDCEGHDVAVLRSNDWDRYRPTLVLAEAHRDEDISTLNHLMEEVGYRLRSQFDLTLIYEVTGR